MTGSTMFKAVPALVLMVAAAVPMASHAADVRPVAKIGFDFGGDNLVTAQFTNGSSDSIKAGELLYLGGGASIITDSKDIEVEVTLSYKFKNISATNGDIKWTRYPLEALVFYRFPKYRLGGGLTYHLSPKVSGSGVASNINGSFDDSLGFVLQGDYLITQKVSVGARYTSLKYKVGGASFDGSSLGITAGYRF
jgi:outer membrane protein with beta-barrel domain